MRAINTKLQVQICEKKIIYFSQTLKKFNISVNITLIKYKIIFKSIIKY